MRSEWPPRHGSWNIPVVLLDGSTGSVECFAHAFGETHAVRVLSRRTDHDLELTDSPGWVLCVSVTGGCRLHLYYGDVKTIVGRALGASRKIREGTAA
jgi:hypothetical protein